MNIEEQKLTAQYGITQTSKTLYSYKHYRYENLKDALNYAELDSKRAHGDSLPALNEK